MGKIKILPIKYIRNFEADQEREIINNETPEETAARFFKKNHIPFWEPITYKLWFEPTTKENQFFAFEEFTYRNLWEIKEAKQQYIIVVIK